MGNISQVGNGAILDLQSISWDAADNVSHPRRLDPTMELITYSVVLYLQHGRRDVKCKLSMGNGAMGRECVTYHKWVMVLWVMVLWVGNGAMGG